MPLAAALVGASLLLPGRRSWRILADPSPELSSPVSPSPAWAWEWGPTGVRRRRPCCAWPASWRRCGPPGATTPGSMPPCWPRWSAAWPGLRTGPGWRPPRPPTRSSSGSSPCGGPNRPRGGPSPGWRRRWPRSLSVPSPSGVPGRRSRCWPQPRRLPAVTLAAATVLGWPRRWAAGAALWQLPAVALAVGAEITLMSQGHLRLGGGALGVDAGALAAAAVATGLVGTRRLWPGMVARVLAVRRRGLRVPGGVGGLAGGDDGGGDGGGGRCPGGGGGGAEPAPGRSPRADLWILPLHALVQAAAVTVAVVAVAEVRGAGRPGEWCPGVLAAEALLAGLLGTRPAVARSGGGIGGVRRRGLRLPGRVAGVGGGDAGGGDGGGGKRAAGGGDRPDAPAGGAAAARPVDPAAARPGAGGGGDGGGGGHASSSERPRAWVWCPGCWLRRRCSPACWGRSGGRPGSVGGAAALGAASYGCLAGWLQWEWGRRSWG